MCGCVGVGVCLSVCFCGTVMCVVCAVMLYEGVLVHDMYCIILSS